MQMHADQLTVSPETVRTLVDRQFPEWRSLPVRSIAAQGTVNAVFRIGDWFAARFPLESADVESTRRWLAPKRKRLASWQVARASPRPSRSRSVNPGQATRSRGRCRHGCPGPWPTTLTPANPMHSPATWPISSATYAQSTRVAARLPTLAEEATCNPMTHGW